jgi:hypothetical protein
MTQPGFFSIPKRTCPQCGAALPMIRIARTFRQFFRGGWTCKQCGAEIDRKGKVIEKKKPS